MSEATGKRQGINEKETYATYLLYFSFLTFIHTVFFCRRLTQCQNYEKSDLKNNIVQGFTLGVIGLILVATQSIS